MAKLTAAERKALPDRAFAYVDRSGKRRLPIYDASHVRNALSRFDQVQFESDADRDRALKKLLAAARKFRIVPIGFVDRQIRVERAGRADTPPLPTGFVTMLMTDVEGSTGHLDVLGGDYASVLDRVRAIHRDEIERAGGVIVVEHADDVFAAFELPRQGLDAAIGVLRSMATAAWPAERSIRVRAGLHAGYPTVRAGDYVGMAVHTTARVSDAAHGGQLLVSDDLVAALGDESPAGIRFIRKGRHRLRGIPDEVTLHQITIDGLRSKFPPIRL
ncbi:MAG: adenylate/guanylate cyclase domain-containing protein [Ilumatobacter sp.]|nr:adenylate/guanylate cyclase domain-containing protein [Ilumatobacter sp.]